jgi:hypothetical protein
MGFFTNLRKPWIRRNYTREVFALKISYLVRHLSAADRRKVRGNSFFGHEEKWQSAKEKKVSEMLARGVNPGSFPPIRLVLHSQREEFRVDDGISRIRAFKMHRIKRILAEIRVGEW